MKNYIVGQIFKLEKRLQSQTEAILQIILQKIGIPLKNMSSFKNSLWSCKRIGVLGIGENPNAGIPTSLRNLLSVPAGKICGLTLIWLWSHPALKA